MHACIEKVARRGCAAAIRPPLTVSSRLPAGSQPKAPANRQLVSARVAFADTSSLVSAEPSTVQKKYILGELLGSGTAGQVHVGTESQSGLQYAVKVLPKRKGSKDRTKVIRSEIDISRRLRNCRHAVKMMDHFEDDQNIYVVQELCCGGDLADLMSAHEGRLSQQEAATIIRCVLEFLADCHAKQICYGDVKPNNFVLRSLYPSIAHLLDPSRPMGLLEVVAVDFGCCQVMDEASLPDSKVTGTPLYMAPENLRGCHGMEVDIWAAGVMLYQLLSDRFPFWDLDIHQMDALGGSAIREGILYGPVLFPQHPWNTSDIHPSVQDLIMRMLDRRVEKRITAQEALKHPWFEHALQMEPALL